MSLLNDIRALSATPPLVASTQEPIWNPEDAIASLDEATWAQMEHYYDNPTERPTGETTYIPEMNTHFKWVPGYTNLFTGWPGDGKSEYERQLDILQAVYAQKKSLHFVPEDAPPIEVWYDAVIHSLTGMNPDSSVPGCLPRAYYKRAVEYIREYMFVVRVKRGQGKTPSHILDIFEAGRAKRGITRFCLDPWNKADHSGMTAAGGLYSYLVKELGNMTEWATETQAYLNIIAHPRGQMRLKGEARAVPDSDGVSGGQTWDDMSMTISAVYRPNKHIKRNDPAVAYYCHKIKSHRRAGAKPGSIGEGSENPDILINYDWKTSQYTFNGSSPLADPYVQAIFAPELAAQTQEKKERDAELAKAEGQVLPPITAKSLFEEEGPAPIPGLSQTPLEGPAPF